MNDSNANKPPSNNPRRARRRRPRRPQGAPNGAPQQASTEGQKNPQQHNAAPQAAQNPQQNSNPGAQGSPSSRSKRNRNRRGGGGANRGANPEAANRGPQPERLSALDRVIVKYENLRGLHLEARKKYFELFDRADPRQKEKLERQFSQSAARLQEFETQLNPQEKALFDQHYNSYPKDLTYAENRQIGPDAPAVPFEGDFDDPHLLESQRKAKYAGDTEESLGTFEDYKSYKGI